MSIPTPPRELACPACLGDLDPCDERRPIPSLECPRCDRVYSAEAGFLDFLDLPTHDEPVARGGGQRGLGPRLMHSRALARIYERVWRPFFVAVASAGGVDYAHELAQIREWLVPAHGGALVDLSCGPGFTRILARAPMELPTHRVPTPDGWVLDVLDLAPAGPPRGIVVAGHAMMVDRRTFRPDRPGLARTLVDAGFRVLLPDLRGHGRSGPLPRAGGDWSYDQLVADTAVLVELARTLAPGLPLALLGHSLFAHTSLAWLGQHPDAPVAAHVALAMDVWLRSSEPSRARWLLKRGAMAIAERLAAAHGHFPATRLRLGNMDESAGYWRDIARNVREGRWLARDGTDYHAGLARVTCPCLHVVSVYDSLYARPASALRLTAAIAHRTVWQLGRDPAHADLRLDHMGLLTGASAALWRSVAAWLTTTLPPPATTSPAPML